MSKTENPPLIHENENDHTTSEKSSHKVELEQQELEHKELAPNQEPDSDQVMESVKAQSEQTVEPVKPQSEFMQLPDQAKPAELEQFKPVEQNVEQLANLEKGIQGLPLQPGEKQDGSGDTTETRPELKELVQPVETQQESVPHN